MEENGEKSTDDNVMMITSMDGEVPPEDTADSGIQGVKLSIKDGTLYLDEEVLSVQEGVGADANGKRTPAFLVKVKPGPMGGYIHHLGTHDILETGNFHYSYNNEEGNVAAKLFLGNHFMTSKDFTTGYKEGEDTTASDGTIMTLEGFSSSDPSDGIKMASIFEPGLGEIHVLFSYGNKIEQLKTADEVMELLKPHLEDFKSRFEVVSEWDNEDDSPQSYVQLDSDFFSYNVNNQEKLKLDFEMDVTKALDDLSRDSIRMEFKQANKNLKLVMEPGMDGFDNRMNINGKYVPNEDLYKQYGKGLLVALTPDGNGTYDYDNSKMLLLTDKAAIKTWSLNSDGSGFTKEKVKSGLDFVFGNGALILK